MPCTRPRPASPAPLEHGLPTRDPPGESQGCGRLALTLVLGRSWDCGPGSVFGCGCGWDCGSGSVFGCGCGCGCGCGFGDPDWPGRSGRAPRRWRGAGRGAPGRIKPAAAGRSAREPLGAASTRPPVFPARFFPAASELQGRQFSPSPQNGQVPRLTVLPRGRAPSITRSGKNGTEAAEAAETAAWAASWRRRRGATVGLGLRTWGWGRKKAGVGRVFCHFSFLPAPGSSGKQAAS